MNNEGTKEEQDLFSEIMILKAREILFDSRISVNEIASIVVKDWAYPVLIDGEGLYHVYLGGIIGLSEGFEFGDQTEAIRFFERALEEEGY